VNPLLTDPGTCSFFRTTLFTGSRSQHWFWPHASHPTSLLHIGAGASSPAACISPALIGLAQLAEQRRLRPDSPLLPIFTILDRPQPPGFGFPSAGLEDTCMRSISTACHAVNTFLALLCTIHSLHPADMQRLHGPFPMHHASFHKHQPISVPPLSFLCRRCHLLRETPNDCTGAFNESHAEMLSTCQRNLPQFLCWCRFPSALRILCATNLDVKRYFISPASTEHWCYFYFLHVKRYVSNDYYLHRTISLGNRIYHEHMPPYFSRYWHWFSWKTS
jgi:hypothetical protein